MKVTFSKGRSNLLKIGLALFIAFQNLLLVMPYDALAQEATPAEEEQEVEVTPTETPEPTLEVTPTTTIEATPEVTPTETPEPTLEPTETPEPTEALEQDEVAVEEEIVEEEYVCIPDKSVEWKFDETGKTVTLVGQVNECTVYSIPFATDLTIKFTKLPEDLNQRGGLSVTEVILSDRQVKELDAISNIAYDFQTEMADGTFEYELELPMPELYTEANLEVKYAESEQQLLDGNGTVDQFSKNNDSVSFNADHFTIFVITNPTPPPTLIIGNTFDNDEGASVYNETGTWATSSCPGWDEVTQTATGTSRYAANGSGGSVATWTFTVPITGNYQVSASWSTHSNRATAAPFTINSNDPIETVFINQSAPGGCGWSDFVDIGSVHHFTEGTTYTVSLSNDSAGGYVIADAIRLTSVDEIVLKDIHYDYPLDGDMYGIGDTNIDFQLYARYGNFLDNPSGEPYRVATRFADLSDPSLDTCQEVYTNPYYNEINLDLTNTDTYTYQGSWGITSIPDGEYIICALMHRGVIDTFGNFVISSEGYVPANTAEVHVIIDRTPAPGSLQGRKYMDHDQDGIHEPGDGEDRLNDWNINLYMDDDGDWVYLDSSLTGETGMVGQWRFEELEFGTYYVCEEARDGWIQTGPMLGTNPVDFDNNVVHPEVTAVNNLSPNSADEGSICWMAELDDADDQFGWMKFGNFELGSIQGRKFFDINADSYHQLDDGEVRLNDWNINLYVDDGGDWSYVDTQVTGADYEEGQYKFDNLDEGTYYVCEELQEGWVQSSPMLDMSPVDFDKNIVNDAEAVANESGNSDEGEICWKIIIDLSGEDYTWVKFGNYETSLIQGRKIQDNNMNGVDNSEPRLNDWTVKLFRYVDSAWELFDTRLTGEGAQTNGQFSFGEVPLGEYLVCEVMQEDWMQTGPILGASINGAEAVENPLGIDELGETCWYVNIEEPSEVVSLRFANYEYAYLEGYKWWDEDADGNWDGEEMGIPGWEMFIDLDMDEEWDVDEPKATTDENGKYYFDDLVNGEYQVCELNLNEHWIMTYPEDFNCYEFTVDSSGQEFYEKDFGNFRYAYIQGRKFYDINANGVFDDEERNAPGQPNHLNDWTIYLYNSEWDEIASAVTGTASGNIGNVGKGQYRFDYLYPGRYYVCEELREGWAETRPHDGMGAYIESDVDGVAMGCYEIVLESGQERGGVTFGNVETGMIAGFKFRDVNGDGNIDPSDTKKKNKLNGWMISLYSVAQGEIIDVYETGSNDIGKGRYEFVDLLPGEYIVCEEMQDAWVQTYPYEVYEDECHEIVLEPNQEIIDVLFGNFEYGIVQGVKYHDLNGNGYHEDSEGTISEVRINLYSYDGAWYLYDSMVTGDDSTPAGNVANGQYRFIGLDFGSYLVCEETVGDMVQTGPILGTHPVNKSGEQKNDATAVENTTGNPDEEGVCWQFEIEKSSERYKFMKFGNAETVSVSGVKWNDVNYNGVNNSEPRLSGWTIFVDYNGNSTLDVDEPSQVTGASGDYLFTDLLPGEYSICEVPQANWVQTYPGFNTYECHDLETTSGQTIEGVDFGNYYDLFPSVTISTSPGDSTVEQAITLTANPTGGNPALSIVMWSDGNFAGCTGNSASVVTPSTPGTYYCKVTITDFDGDIATAIKTVVVSPAPETPTTPTNTGTGNNGGTNTTEITTQVDEEEEEEEPVEEQGEVFGIDTCEETVKISGHAYVDSNNNEEFDEDDQVFADMEIEIYYFDALGERQTVVKVMTDENGYWEAEVCPGDYEAEILGGELPDNVELPDESVLSFSVSDGEEETNLNFQLVETAGINWWWCIIPLILLLLAMFFLWLSRRNDKDKLKVS